MYDLSEIYRQIYEKTEAYAFRLFIINDFNLAALTYLRVEERLHAFTKTQKFND